MVRFVRLLPVVAAVACAPVDDPLLGATGVPLADSALAEGGEALPLPPPGVPLSLVTTDVLPGTRTELEVGDADPGETVHFLRGTSGVGQGPCPGALGGHCLDLLAPIVHMGTGVADAYGVARFAFDVPVGAPMGREVFFEAAAARGVDSVSSAAVARVIGEVTPWRFTVAVDGDLADWDDATTRFDTSSVGGTRVAWDATFLYLGLDHPDLATGGPEHWSIVYLSTALPGTTEGLLHRTQAPALPFEASVAVRRKADGSYDSLEVFDGQQWVSQPQWLGTEGSAVAAVDDRLELALPLDLLQGATRFELVAYHLYEGAYFESSYGVAPADSFVEGYDPDPATAFAFDLEAPEAPVDQVP